MKVGDFGLAENMYATGDVREDRGAVKVHYEWMPPESLEDGLFSEHSDVVYYTETKMRIIPSIIMSSVECPPLSFSSSGHMV